MRCAEILRELTTPTGGVDAAGLAQHLADCDRCRGAAAAVERFDRVWMASQPPEPPAGSFDRIWSQVIRASEDPAILPMTAGSPRRQPWAVPLLSLVVVAQAAALLVAFSGALHRQAEPASSPATAIAATLPEPADLKGPEVVFELDEGQTLVMHLNEKGDQLVCTPRYINMVELVNYDGETPNPFDGAMQSVALIIGTMEAMEP